MADERDPSEPVDRTEIAEGPNPEGHADQARTAHQRDESDASAAQRNATDRVRKPRRRAKES